MLKKICAILMSVVFCFSTVAFADSVLDKYEPEDGFEYSDEIIGRALQSSVGKIYNLFTATLSYEPLELNFTDLIRDLTILKQNNPNATQQEINDYVYDKITKSAYFSYGEPKTAKATIGATGSGVVLSDDGYIATNQHVIEYPEEERLDAYISQGLQEAQEDYNALISQLRSAFGDDYLDEEAMDFWANVVVSAYQSKLKISDEKGSLTVRFPDADGNTDESKAVSYPAKVVEEGDQNQQGNTEDAAIIKIDADNLVALEVAEDYPNVNTVIYAAGFPSASSRLFDLAGENTSDTLAVTITNGTVSRLVPIDNSQYKMIQTTAITNHGNSGGPSVDKTLEVEGLNTLANSETDVYAMVPAEVLLDRASGISIDRGDASKLFIVGLQSLQQGFGKTALDSFNELKALQPDMPYINVLIKDAQNMEQNVMPAGLNSGLIYRLVIFIAIAAVLALIIILIAKNAQKRKRKAAARRLNSGLSGFDNDDIVPNNNNIIMGGETYDFDTMNNKENDFDGSDWL